MPVIKQYLDIFLMLVFTVILILLILIFPINILRTIIGLPFVLFLPGYMVIAALFTRKNSIGDIERIVFSFGLSIAVVPLLGLMMNYTPWGIRLDTILFTLTSFVIIMTIIIVIRRHRLPHDERFIFKLNLTSLKNLFSNQENEAAPDTVGTTPVDKPKSRIKWLDNTLSIILIIAVAGTIGVFIYSIYMPKTVEKFTEFYILGTDGKAQNYPKEIKFGENAKVFIGIANHEQAIQFYRLNVSTDNVTNTEIPSIILDKEEKWERLVGFTPATSGHNQRVEFQLYKAESANPYLTLHLWVDVIE